MKYTGKTIVSNINRVEQKDTFGCVVACIAMITEKTYEEIKSAFPNKDFSKSGLAIDFDGNSYLNEHGYLTRVIYPTIGYNQQKRLDWIKPFAPIHIVRVISESGNSHAVVMDMCGNITDPFKEGVFTLSDYDVKDITGIWKPGDAIFPSYEEALEAGLQYALNLISTKGEDKIESPKEKKPPITFSDYVILERGSTFYFSSLDQMKSTGSTLEQWFSNLYYDYNELYIPKIRVEPVTDTNPEKIIKVDPVYKKYHV